MKIAVGSTNETKIDAVKETLTLYGFVDTESIRSSSKH